MRSFTVHGNVYYAKYCMDFTIFPQDTNIFLCWVSSNSEEPSYIYAHTCDISTCTPTCTLSSFCLLEISLHVNKSTKVNIRAFRWCWVIQASTCVKSDITELRSTCPYWQVTRCLLLAKHATLQGGLPLCQNAFFLSQCYLGSRNGCKEPGR